MNVNNGAQLETNSSDITDVPQNLRVNELTPTASAPETKETSSSEETLHVQPQRPVVPPANLRTATGDTDTPVRPQRPFLPSSDSRSTIALEGWVDGEYFSENPWYGLSKKKPVFSLARPLPHTLRRSARPGKGDIENQGDAFGADREDLSGVPLPFVPERLSRSSNRHIEQRMTASGAAHSGKRNDAGQPVFTYLPRESTCPNDEYDTLDRNEIKESNREPQYGIDSEPLGRREDTEVEDGEKNPDELRNWWARVRARHPEPLAEFLAVSRSLVDLMAAELTWMLDRCGHLPGFVRHIIRQPWCRSGRPVRDV